jgi:hypothetical protein
VGPNAFAGLLLSLTPPSGGFPTTPQLRPSMRRGGFGGRIRYALRSSQVIIGDGLSSYTWDPFQSPETGRFGAAGESKEKDPFLNARIDSAWRGNVRADNANATVMSDARGRCRDRNQRARREEPAKSVTPPTP